MNIENLLAYYKSKAEAKNRIFDPKTLKYAIYARKSTDAADKQEFSIPDQIKECNKLVASQGLRVVGEPIIEKKSASTPNIRPEFKKLLHELEIGKYDGIISWHPDRLSRNMLEAGQIIDMVDNYTIKDLKFCSFVFENTPNGKMMLGINFLMAKGFTDNLKKNVDRGNKSKNEQGINFGKVKHGYIWDDEGEFIPNPTGFPIIQRALKMRLEGFKCREIAEYLNNSDYYYYYSRKDQRSNKKRTKIFNHKYVSDKLLKDPICCGIYYIGKNVSYLPEIYDFIPMLTIEEFISINNELTIKNGEFKKLLMQKRGRDKTYTICDNLVICDECKRPMYNCPTGVSRYGKRYAYFECRIDGCENYGTRFKPSKS